LQIHCEKNKGQNANLKTLKQQKAAHGRARPTRAGDASGTAPLPLFTFQGSPAHCTGAAPIPQGANGIPGYKKPISDPNGSKVDGSAL